MKRIILLCLILLSACNQNIEKTEQPIEPLYDYDVEERLEELNITLMPSPPPVANYVNAVKTGNLMFLAGKGPTKAEGGYITGKVGVDLTIEEGYEAARRTAIAQLSVL